MVLSAALLLQGCQSYEIVQRNIFADDDGRIVFVDYGRSDSEHHNTFLSPVTGKEMDFHSRLVLKVQFPDGDDVTAWQCMNFLSRGTMYMTDDEEWKILANGFSLIIYRRTDEKPPRYREVYRGVLCESPDNGGVKKDDRWRDVNRFDTGRESRKSETGNGR